MKWETRLGVPTAWQMSQTPGDSLPQTIPDNPTHRRIAAAEREFTELGRRGAGQPYLLAVKLRDEPNTLHLRAYLRDADQTFAWADFGLLPPTVQALAAKTSRTRALE